MISPEQLQALPIFADFDPRSLRTIGALFSRREVGPGTVLLEQGSRTGGALLVLAGLVRVERAEASGAVVAVERLGPGALCGAEEVIEGIPRRVSHVAEGRVSVGIITSSDLSELMDGRSRVALCFQLAAVRAMFGALRRGNARLAGAGG